MPTIVSQPRRAPPRFVVSAVLAMHRRLTAFVESLVPAPLAVLDKGFGYTRTILLGAAARHCVADLLGNGPRSAEQIAAELGTDPETTYRMMRALVSFGVFALTDDLRFENNRQSDALRSGAQGDPRSLLEYLGSVSNLLAWADFETTLRTGKTAFDRVHGVSVWDWFEKHPHEGTVFAASMNAATEMDAPAIAAAWPFGTLDVLCDVAGGRGALLSEILLHHPHTRGVLVDSAHVLAQAGEYLESRGVAGRVERVPANFFEAIPVRADGFVLKDILHDWDDARSGRILGNVRKASRDGTRLFIAETVLERASTEHPGPLMDLHMLMVCGEGRQRSREEFAVLLGKAGFRLDEVIPLAGFSSLVVATAV